MTKRLILAVVLSVVVLFVSDIFLQHFYGKRVPEKANQEQQKEIAETITKPIVMPQTSTTTTLPTAEKKGKEIKIESELYQVVFSGKGEILHWYLKNYKKDGTDLFDLVPSSKPISDYSYEISPLKDKNGVLLHTIIDGVDLTKEFIFDETKNYEVSIHFKIINNSPQEKDVSLFKWDSGIGGATNPKELAITSSTKKGISRWKAHKIKETIRQDRDTKWTGLAEKYFAIALIPEVSDQQSLIISKENNTISIQSVIEKVPSMARMEGKLLVYAGPKEEKTLKAAGNNLYALIDYGLIGKGIFSLLKWFYYITKNYGLAIILLSVLIKVILFPLTKMGLKSTRDIQKIQPQLAMLRQRFKHDPEALNRETMELYKRMKINPLGGCLPMLLQLPIFWALFVVLRDAIELRHAPFIFWIRDLSSKDPYYILPILMGVTTFIQQKMSASAGGTQQQSTMVYFMTIFLTVIFLNFPSGLVLYWLITNILSIGEQQLVNRTS